MITTNIRPISNHNYSGNITTQSQHQITTGIMNTDTETDPIFRHSPAYGITEQDIQNWNEGAGIDLSSYVTHDFLSEQAYLTSETDPVFSASPAAGITSEDIENWNAGAGVDLSSYVTYGYMGQTLSAYVTYEYLSAQSYLTSVTFPDYSNTYQSKGDYITPDVLASQSYITPDVLASQSYITPDVLASQAYLTSETDPVFSASPAGSITDVDIANWNAAAGTIDMGAYVTKAQLAAQSYVTTSDLAAQAYLTSETDPVFSASPAAGITTEDIENWNAGGAVDLSSYVTYEYLSAQSYIKSLPIVGSPNAYNIINNDDNIYLHSEFNSLDYDGQPINRDTQIITNEIHGKTRATIAASSSYNGTSYESTIWLTTSTQDEAHPDRGQSRIQIASDVVEMNGSISIGDVYGDYQTDISYHNKTLYISAPITSLTSGTVQYNDFQQYIASYGYVLDKINDYVVSQSYITPDVLASQAYLTSETDPVFSASPAAGITAQDIQNWNAGGAVDLSSYVTYEYLSAQSYLTSVTFPDYSNTYQAKGNYLTTETDPVFSASPAAGITAQDIQNWDTCAGLDLSSYVTYEYLSAQSYLTSVTFPDYSNTYQAKGDYVTNTALANQSYVTKNELAAQSYVTNTSLSRMAYVKKSDLSAQSYVTSAALSNYGYVKIKLVTQSQYIDRQDNILYVITDAPPIS